MNGENKNRNLLSLRDMLQKVKEIGNDQALM